MYWEGASFGNVLFIVFLFVLQFVSFVFLIFYRFFLIFGPKSYRTGFPLLDMSSCDMSWHTTRT